MGNAPLFACLLCCLLMSFGDAQDVSTSSCAEYVIEGETLDCQCLGHCSDNTVTPTWPGHTDTDHLVLTNITRQQDGEEFVCQMECGGQNYTTTYTVNVAYGPGIEVLGPSPFITFNGTQMMTLACHATVNPAVDYGWLGVECENGKTHNTCRYVPNVTDDGTLVACVAINRIFNPPKKQRSRPFTLHLYYPPQPAPNISEGSGSILTAKDILTCTVTGGKPLVDSVNFTCTSPYHRTQDRETTSTSVSSSLTIDTSQATTDNITCYCSANWAPRPEFYTMKSERNFLIEFVGPDVVPASTNTIIIIVVSGSVGTLSAVVIIVVVVRRKRKGKNTSNDDHQTSQSPYFTNPTFPKNGADADTDSGVVMSAYYHSPYGAGYAAVGDFPSSTQPDGVRRQTSSGSAAYEVTDIAMGRVSIKEAAPPQPNVYQEPWDAVKAQSMVAECFTGHAVIIATEPEGDKHSI